MNKNKINAIKTFAKSGLCENTSKALMRENIYVYSTPKHRATLKKKFVSCPAGGHYF